MQFDRELAKLKQELSRESVSYQEMSFDNTSYQEDNIKVMKMSAMAITDYGTGTEEVTKNYKIKSYDTEGDVTDMYSGGYRRLTTYSSSVSKLNDTDLKQSISFNYNKYIPVGINWIKIGSDDGTATQTYRIN